MEKKNEKIRNYILKHLTQLFLVVFSVVLGIYLSGRIEDQKNEKNAQKLLSKIKSELAVNKQLLDEWHPYHVEVVNKLDSLIKDEVFIEAFIKDKDILFSTAFTKGTFMGRTPSSDTWDIAKSHPLIVNFDYDDLLDLSKIYNQQNATYNSFDKLMMLIFDPKFNSKENAEQNIILFRNMIREMVSKEQQLYYYYTTAEKTLNYSVNNKTTKAK